MPGDPRFESLTKAGADPDVVAALAALVAEGTDRDVCRVDPLAFAAQRGLDPEHAIDGFVHAAKQGLFDMSWSISCPGCGGILEAGATLRTVHTDNYYCSLCYAAYEPSLDELVEVSFTVSPVVRRIPAHDPDTMPLWDYYAQIYFSNRWDGGDRSLIDMARDVALESEELPARGKVVASVQVPAGKGLLLFEPVKHTCSWIKVEGEPTRDRQDLAFTFSDGGSNPAEATARPGPVRFVLENKTDRRLLPSLFVIGDSLHDMLAHQKTFLTAKRILTNQTFRDLYRTDTLAVDQRLKITSLTVLFTDLKGSTELYERVGDLQAFDLVRSHFRVLGEVVRSQGGAVVKTIGDAVMATFPTPDRGAAAALAMRKAMVTFNAAQKHDDLVVKIGLHEGPCLAVMLNERLDYFGQTVNIAARVQGLATARSIFATEPVVSHADVARLLDAEHLTPVPQRATLRGISEELTVFEIP